MSWLYTIVYAGIIVFCASQTFYPILMIMAMLLRQSKLLYPFFHSVDVNSSKHGGKLVAEVLKSHGIPHVFTLAGGHISPILVAANEMNIKIVDVRHEATAVFAADASARLTGIPGVAVVTAGPGLTNTVTAIKNAQLGESPLIVMAGASATMLKGRGSLQDIDQTSLLKTATKKCFRVDCVREIVPTLREAFRVAQVGVPGPVLVELPIDTLYPYQIIAKQFLAMTKSSTTPDKQVPLTDGATKADASSTTIVKKKKPSLMQRIINAYSSYQLKYIFADAFNDCDTDALPISIKSPPQASVKQVADMLAKAKRPLIIAGSQSVLGPFGGSSIADRLKKLNIPIYVNGAARGLMGADYSLQFLHARKAAVKEADFVLLLGAICDFRLSYGQIFNKSSKIVCVNRSNSQAKLNAGIFWFPSLTVEADVGKFVLELEKVISDQKQQICVDSDWLELLKKRDNDKDLSIASLSNNGADKYSNPLRVLTELRKLLEKDADKDLVLIADGGDFVATASYIIKPNKPMRWLDPGPFGTLGCGAGFALAAKLLLPNARVISIVGDGAFGYAVPELDTFVRHKLETLWLIGNDACWTQIAREQLPMLGSTIGCELAYSSYEQVANAFGAQGLKVDADNELAATLQEAFKLLENNKQTVVINALIGKTTFREGSISV